MTQEEILDFNKRCAEFLKGMTYIKRLPEGFVNSHDLYRVDISSFEKPISQELLDKINFYNSENVKLDAYILLSELKFHSDWNWIMEVIDAIEKLEFNFDSYNPSGIGKNGFYEFNIWNRINPEIQGRGNTSKEAYIDAINQFLIWYKQNK